MFGNGGRGIAAIREEDYDNILSNNDFKGLKFHATSSLGVCRTGYMVCPYDPLHVVPSSSFCKHKLKCERKEKERLGIADEFNEMQYRNRFESSLVNGTPFPKPPLHVTDLREDDPCARYYADTKQGALDWIEDDGIGTLPPSAAAANSSTQPGPAPIPQLRMADANLRYFEPAGLTPAMRREFRKRRHAAAAAAGFVEKTMDSRQQEREIYEEYEELPLSGQDNKNVGGDGVKQMEKFLGELGFEEDGEAEDSDDDEVDEDEEETEEEEEEAGTEETSDVGNNDSEGGDLDEFMLDSDGELPDI